jgi:acyl-CoA synthetase (NDP forming)
VECLAAASNYQPRKPKTGLNFTEKTYSVPLETAELLTQGRQNIIWDEFDSKRLLEKCSIAVVEEQLVSTATAALQVGRRIGFPVVVKGLVPGQVHKTEAGLVRLGIGSASELKKVYKEFHLRLDGEGKILIQKQLLVDFELIAGFLRDEQFGPCIMFGLGGVFSELQRDVVFALAPLSREEARSLIFSIKGKKLLGGFRGMAPINEEAMADILVNLGSLGVAHPEIAQIDINPLAVFGGNPIAVDATIILADTNKGNNR